MFLANLDWSGPIEEVLLVLKQQSIEILLMLNQLLLSSRCLELMRSNLQGHLLIVRVLLLLRLLLWVVNEILRSLMLSLLCILIDHVVDKSLNTAS